MKEEEACGCDVRARNVAEAKRMPDVAAKFNFDRLPGCVNPDKGTVM